MKNTQTIALATLIILIGVFGFQTKEPWTAKQMVSPYELNKQMRLDDKTIPVLLSVGPEAVIEGSVDIGPGQDGKNIDKLIQRVEKLDKDQEIIIYCGCCPLQKCPNVRPAFKALNDLGFNQHKLLAILNNIKTDWIDKGYPTAQTE
ncbi:rhodanese-like domain-containing protein [Echinicola strongylocentroti]|uniref:Rhodanese-like domain-containing protein n=1 Tax=Echinicola strongylocentroti TaxID=1795355 RepID=A0A2Z4ICM1_9BACT|nr:rhodanese-like domain-containing protein [Echinicola strongylocentroti]AWW28702.1 rhodanese-like domain-containing protein [Echinicola strongylocentroti]